MVPLPKWSLQCMKPHPDPEPEWWPGGWGVPGGGGGEGATIVGGSGLWGWISEKIK